MSDENTSEQSYLKQHCLTVYFEDVIRSLLETRRRPSQSAKVDVNAFLRDYFLQVKRESHVTGRDFAFINSTPYNRRVFLTHIYSKCESSIPIPNTLKEIHAFMLTICPDFPYSLLEASAVLVEDMDTSMSIDYVIFLRAFQIRFLYDEFINESQHIFRSFSHRLTCHVPTAEISVPQQENNNSQIIYDAFGKLISSNACICPPLNILEEVLLSTEQQQQLSHQKFLIQLVKNEKLIRLLGKDMNNLKQQRTFQQQRSTNDPSTTASIQNNETKVLLTSLSTPTTRISSPIAPPNLLPPLPKQQVLVREKPIRQGSPASGIIPKRVDSATSAIVTSSSTKSATPMRNVVKQAPSESDSDIESRTSDSDN